MVKEGIVLTTILISTMVAGTGAQFIIDMIQGLSTPMYQIFGINTKQLNLIYTFYSSINLVFAPFGGYLIIKYGVGNAATFFSALVFLGISIGNYGAYTGNWFHFQIGWIFVGMGIESLINTQVSTCEKWFSGRYLSFSIGLKFAFSLAIGSLSGYLCPELFIIDRNIQVPFFVAAVSAFLGFVAAALLNVFDFAFEPMIKDFESVTFNGDDEDMEEEEEGEEEMDKEMLEYLMDEEEYQFRASDIFKLKPVYWVTISIYCFQFNLFTQYLHIITDLSVVRFNYSYEEAKNFIAFYKGGVLVMLPLVSYLLGKFGKKSLVLALSSIICLVGYIYIYLLPPTPSYAYLASVMMISISYSMYTASIWPSMSVALPRSAVSFGYGVASSAQQVAGAIFPFFVGKLSEGRTVESYERVLGLLCGLSVVCIVLGVILVIVDIRGSKALWLPDNSEIVFKYRLKLDMEFRKDQRNKRRESKISVGEGESRSTFFKDDTRVIGVEA